MIRVSRGEHPAGQEPPSPEPEHQQEGHHARRDRREIAEQVGVAAHQEEHPWMDAAREGQVHAGHPALAEEGQDLVTADPGRARLIHDPYPPSWSEKARST